jgi:L-ascorbate metabolism protein UlaG (beta-lactamase superfamily)
VTGAPFDGTRFSNEDPSAFRGLGDVLRWAITRRFQPWPAWVENRVRFEPRTPRGDEVLVTFVNHATFLLQHASITLLTDPVWSRRVSPVQWSGPARVHAPGIPFDDLPHVDLVLVSHSHYDHMDVATLRRLQQRFRPRVVTTLGNKAFLERNGLQSVAELDWWQSLDFVTATPAQHFAARTPFDRNRTLWAGFALRLGERRLFFTGDSGYAPHFARIGERLGPFDAAFIPIGAYEPRWFMCVNHMNPEEAVRAHLDLRSRLSVAMHFGCFQLTDEPRDEPLAHLARARDAHGVLPSSFRALDPGETLAI